MTEINLITSDQRLIAVQKVVIASGDVNSVRLKVAFDSVWNRFTHKTAVFHTSDDPTMYETMLIDSSCVVPWEVLQKPGTLFIGVVGIGEDGLDIDTQDTKTSTLVKYKIEQGAERANTTLTPSMDLYQQYLKAFDDRVDPFRADVYAQMDAKIAEMETKMRQHEEALANITEGELLWKNDDESVAFARQTIELNLSKYKKIVVFLRSQKGNSTTGEYTEAEIRMKNVLHCVPAGKDYSRELTWQDSGIVVGTGYVGTISNNEYAIPTKIIGFNAGGIKENDSGFDI